MQNEIGSRDIVFFSEVLKKTFHSTLKQLETWNTKIPYERWNVPRLQFYFLRLR